MDVSFFAEGEAVVCPECEAEVEVAPFGHGFAFDDLPVFQDFEGGVFRAFPFDVDGAVDGELLPGEGE